MVASKGRSGAVEREDGGRQAAGCGEECCARAVARGPCCVSSKNLVASGGGEIGRLATTLGRDAAHRRILAASSVAAVEHTAAAQARRRFESGFENGCGCSSDSRKK
jgi:hypothetical protein